MAGTALGLSGIAAIARSRSPGHEHRGGQLHVADSAVRARLLGLIENVTHAAASSYQTRDNSGFTVDTIKIIPAPGPGYLGVYHVNDKGFFSVRLGFSDDILHWDYIRTLEPDAVQPTIAALPHNAYLVAYEKRELTGISHLEFRVYPSFKALFAGRYDRQFDAPLTLSKIAEGTPSISGMTVHGSVAHSTIDVGFHYFDTALGVDRNGVGVLQDFRQWTAWVSPIDAAFHPEPAGGTGARDSFSFDGYPFTVIEAWSTPNNWGTWRVYLYDETARTITELPIHTTMGSTSFGTPHVTVLDDPHHHRALAISFYLFTPGAAGKEAGPLIYYRDF